MVPLNTDQDQMVLFGLLLASPSGSVVVMAATAPQPLFHQVFREIAGLIDSGELPSGSRLPAERWFGGRLGVSRTTVRRAVDELVEKGLVVHDGRALVVVGPEPTEENPLLTLTELARIRGLESTSRVRRAEVRPATLDEADVMGVAPGSDVFDLVRVRMLDGVEIAVDHDRVAGWAIPDPTSIDFTHASLFGSIEQAGTVLAEAHTQIEACGVTADDAVELDLAPGAPVLVATEEVVDDGGRVVCLSHTVYRSDRHRFLTTFTRRPRRTATPRAATVTSAQGAA
jgi:DNA-binding GntR family transcriptional regulator